MSMANSSSTQLEPTLCLDAKLVSDMPSPVVVTSTIASDNEAVIIPLGKTLHVWSSGLGKQGLASSAMLDRLGFELTQPSGAAHPGFASSAVLDHLGFELAQPLEASYPTC